MHAWVMLWCGPPPSSAASGEGKGGGWIGLDPTNALLASDAHVMLAVGRDYTDVAPMDGVIFGSGGQKIAVSVNVIPVV
jgi:transglutaminase-like putative cysteine protease